MSAGSHTARGNRYWNLSARMRDLWEGRELLKNLVSRDLKVRYKNSILGFGWSLISPLAMMVVFTIIFTQVFQAGLKDFTVFFLAAFLPWQFFANSMMASVGAIVGNANLIKKVYFPREMLPISTVLSAGVHFLLSFAVFSVFILIKGYNFIPFLPALILVFVLQLLFSSGLSMVFAALNVPFRDLQELIQVIFLIWFYATPIIYQFEMFPEKYQWALRLNPMTWFVGAYRDAIYYLKYPSPRLLAVCVGCTAISLVLGWVLFSRLSVSFAKEV